MKRQSKLHELGAVRVLRAAVFTSVLVLSLALLPDGFSIVSHAESAGRVTSSDGARVRSSASSGGDVLASYAKDTTLSIRSQINASDGYVWYEVWVDADKLGYIRSDLVEITDGSTPPESTQVAPTTQEPADTSQPADNSQPADANAGGGASGEVEKVNPVSATVKGSDNVRIRNSASASESSQIVTTVESGVALTVIGQTTGTDGKTWYQVSFNSDGADVTGFIRSDYVDLSEELTPYTEPEESPEPAGDDAEEPEAPAEEKPYDTVFYDGEWKFVVTETGEAYGVEAMLSTISGNNEALEDLQKSKRSQTIAIIILVILLVGVGGAAAYLVYKIKDMEDSAYFNQIEKETIRRRSQPGQRTMHTAGPEKRTSGQGQRPAGASQGTRPAGQRPAGASQGTRPGQRPAGAPQGQRAAGASQGARPAGQRPAGAPQGQRAAGASQGARPAGQRPAGAPQGQRPAGASQEQHVSGAGQTQRPAGQNPERRPQGASPAQRPSGQSQARPQPKNFMTSEEDDEFEFEFLNYDTDDEQ